jgi:hypothetical protein
MGIRMATALKEVSQVQTKDGMIRAAGRGRRVRIKYEAEAACSTLSRSYRGGLLYVAAW